MVCCWYLGWYGACLFNVLVHGISVGALLGGSLQIVDDWRDCLLEGDTLGFSVG